jgi:hypothetical protein
VDVCEGCVWVCVYVCTFLCVCGCEYVCVWGWFVLGFVDVCVSSVW